MKVALQARLNDPSLSADNTNCQRQLEVSVKAIKDSGMNRLPLNLCLVLDQSGSMEGLSLDNVKKAAIALIEKLTPQDRLSVIAFNHQAKVIINNQTVDNFNLIKQKINQLQADGGTSIDEGLKLGLQEIAKGKDNRVSQLLLLTDGENEHGNNDRCIKLAQLASECNVTLSSLGFGNNWNQNVLEAISDEGNGSLNHIEFAEQAVQEFQKLFTRMESVGLTNAFLHLELNPDARLAELKPIAQVAPDTIELPFHQEEGKYIIRLGDVMTEERIILTTLYLGKMSLGSQAIATVQVKYDDPTLNAVDLYSDSVSVGVQVQANYQPQTDDEVQKSILTLAKYRQTQLAEKKLEEGDTEGAATLLQTAAKTAIQLGDKTAATVLQTSATRLQTQGELSEADKKKTRIVSKTRIQKSE